MGILQDELAPLDAKSLVKHGERLLRNARLLADSDHLSPSTVYLEQNDPHTVFCMNGSDIIAVPTDDIYDILNRLLDCFERYDEWDTALDSSIRQGNALSELLSLAAPMLGAHLIVADATYFIHEYALVENLQLPRGFEEAFAHSSMPLETILRIDEDPKVRSPQAGIYPLSLSEYAATFYIGNIFVQGEHEGWIVAYFGNPTATQGQLDLLDFMKTKVESWMVTNEGLSQRREKTGLLTDLLAGANPDEMQLTRLLEIYGWRAQDEKRVFALFPCGPTQRSSVVVERYLRSLSDAALVFSFEEHLVILTNDSLHDGRFFDEQLQELLKTVDYAGGVSPSFQALTALPRCYSCALTAGRFAHKPGDLVTFEQTKLPYALSLINRSAVGDVRHEAFTLLEAYDQRHHTELVKTLQAFVHHRGSFVATAEDLVIHRSTLNYRLTRIQELTGVDFNDEVTWDHLTLSSLLNRWIAYDASES